MASSASGWQRSGRDEGRTMAIADTTRRTLSLSKAPASPLRRAVLTGFVFGIVGIYLAAVGILLMIHGRSIIVDVLTLGQSALIAIALGAGAFIARRESPRGLP